MPSNLSPSVIKRASTRPGELRDGLAGRLCVPGDGVGRRERGALAVRRGGRAGLRPGVGPGPVLADGATSVPRHRQAASCPDRMPSIDVAGVNDKMRTAAAQLAAAAIIAYQVLLLIAVAARPDIDVTHKPVS